MKIPDEVNDEAVLEMVEAHRQTMEEMYKDYPGEDEVIPTAVIHYIDMAKGVIGQMIVGVSGQGDSKEMMLALGKMLKEEHPDLEPYCITFSSEAWSARFKEGEEDLQQRLRDKYGQIENFPKKYKKEVAVVSALTLDGRGTIMSYDIKRDKTGKRTGIKMSFYKPVIDRKQESYLLQAFYVGRYK